MPLESLSQPFNPDEPGRKLREVQVEHEMEEKSTIEQKLDDLKGTKFYDPEQECWRNYYGTEHLKVIDQLVELVVWAELDTSKAQRKLESLRQPRFYNQDTQEWIVDNSNEGVCSKLIEIAIQVRNNVDEGSKTYSSFLEAEPDASPVMFDVHDQANIYTMTELLHVYVQSGINAEKARARYNELLASKIYNPNIQRWYTWYAASSAGGKVATVCNSANFLLGILIELRFGIPGAQEKYEAAKQTDLYDKKMGYWNALQEGVDRFGTSKATISQLIGLAIEARLENKKGATKLSAAREIPEERNF